MPIVRYNPRRGVVVRRAVVPAALYAAKTLGTTLRKKMSTYKFKSGATKSRFQSNIAQQVRDARPVKRLQQYVGMSPSTGNELSSYKKTVGRYPALSPNRLLKLMKSGMNETILRAQGITQFDTNVGYYPLANRSSTDTGEILIPCHVWDLTCFNNTSEVTAGHVFRWASSAGSADLLRNVLPTTNFDGTIENGGFYEVEKTSAGKETGVAYPRTKNACHEWSSISMNLYGARKRGTTYYIDVVRVKNELGHPLAAGLANTELKQLFQQWQSKLIYSNLQQYNKTATRGVQIVKSFKFYVPGGSADDLDTIGKIKEFKLFLKQGNVYDMSWDCSTTADDIGHNVADGQDFTDGWVPVNTPRHGSRLMLVIRAFSPERRTNTAAAWNALGGMTVAPSDALTEPSYDLIVRNKWLVA